MKDQSQRIWTDLNMALIDDKRKINAGPFCCFGDRLPIIGGVG